MPDTRKVQKAAVTHIRQVLLESVDGNQIDQVFKVEDIKTMSDLAMLTEDFVSNLYFTPDLAPAGLRLPMSRGVRCKLLQFLSYAAHRKMDKGDVALTAVQWQVTTSLELNTYVELNSEALQFNS